MKLRVGQWLSFDSGGDNNSSPGADFWYRPASPALGSFQSSFQGSEAQSLQCSTVLKCNKIIAETLAGFPFNVIERLPDGDTRIARDHPVHRVIHDQPNDFQTAFEFWEQITHHIVNWGGGFIRIGYGSKNSIQSLTPMLPSRITPRYDYVEKKKYYINYPLPNGEREILFDDEVIHIPGLGFDGVRGYSWVQLMRMSIGLSLYAEEYGSMFFKNNATPTAYISMPGNLGIGAGGDTARENLLAWMKKQFNGSRNAHKLGVLEGGAKIETVTINHRDIQFLELRKMQAEEIVSAFRIPPHKAGLMSASTNNNIEHQNIEFITDTMKSWVCRIEQRISSHCFGPLERKRFFAEFNLDGAMRGDLLSRTKAANMAVTMAQMTPNEARRLENRPRMEGGDELMIQGAMIPLKMAGQQKVGSVKK